MKKALLTIMAFLIAGSFFSATLAQEKRIDLTEKPGQVAPATQKASKNVIFSESFEDYEDFTTDLSPWTTVQLTSGNTYGITGVTFPHAQEAWAFIVFNPNETTPAMDHPAQDGQKYACAIQYQGIDDNKWLISPQITPFADSELSFWVKSITDQYGLERYAVWVSTTDTEIASFTKISDGEYLEAPTTWTENIFNLGDYDGTPIHFAIQYKSHDAFALFVDNIEVTGTPPAPTFPVTFTVIDQKEIYEKVMFKGTPTDWATVDMEEGPDHTWTLTLDVEPGDHEWGAIEDDDSVDGIWLIEGGNPEFTVDEEGNVTGTTTYTILPPGDKSVTFILDISGLEGFDPDEDFIDLAGDFTGWDGTDPLDVDDEDANIYSITAGGELRPGQIIKFKFRLNGDWKLAETPADEGGNMNRVFVVSEDDAENVYHAVWGENYFHNLGEVEEFEDINVAIDTPLEDLDLPETVMVQLGAPDNLTGEEVELSVAWNTEIYDGTVSGIYELEGIIDLETDDVTYFNGHNLKAAITIKVAVGVNTNPSFQFGMYPNPTSGNLNITAGSTISSIRVFNMLGQQVMNVSNVGTDNLVLSTSELGAGIYIISATDMNGGTVSSRFIKR